VQDQMLGPTFSQRRGRVVYYSTTDDSPVSLRVCKAAGRILARHNFFNLRDRLFPSDRQRIEERMRVHVTSLETLRRSRKHGGVSRSDFQMRKRQLNRLVVKEMKAEFDTLEFREMVPCAAHDGRLCNVSPRSDGSLSNMRWSEAAGNDCTAWSRVGKNSQWVHESCIDSFTWAYSSRFFGVDSL
jgi:hypothetical protein